MPSTGAVRAFLPLLLLLLLAITPLRGEVVVAPGESIQGAVASLPPEGGTVRVAAGRHVLDKGVHISRSNVELVGEAGTELVLGENALQPVILVGTDKFYPTAEDRIANVRISNLRIDGNCEKQAGAYAEYDPSRCTTPGEPTPDTCWIRNNGIDVRAVENLRIENVNVVRARSGGLVVSWKSHNVRVSNSTFNENWFDGIALYDSDTILVTDFVADRNRHAGVSIDNATSGTLFSSGHVGESGEVGLFARHCQDIAFNGVTFADNLEHGAFLSFARVKEEEALAKRQERLDTGVYRVVFSGCSFLRNGGCGIFVGAKADRAKGNACMASYFQANKEVAIAEGTPDILMGKQTNVYAPDSAAPEFP